MRLMSAAARHAATVRWRVEGLPWWRSSPPRRLKDLEPRGSQRPCAVALTFDDGPDPRYTPQILATLSDRGVPATFFVCGYSADRYPELVRAIAAEGHALGGHTWYHVDVRGIDDRTWAAEVEATHRRIAALTGASVRLFRPPWGQIDRAGLQRLASRDLLPVLWSSHGEDWSTDAPGEIAATVRRTLQPGAIILLHDACGDAFAADGVLPPGTLEPRDATVAALPTVIDSIEDEGLGFVSLAR
jgi:peptidoglycan-N-acetylglucosamine deacetylase